MPRMSRAIPSLLRILFFGVLCGPIGAQVDKFPEGVEGEIYYCPRLDLVPPDAAGPLAVVVDGQLDDPVWARADWQGWTHVSDQPRGDGGVTPEEDLSFEWAAVADQALLYVAWRITDDVLQNQESTQCQVWQDDSVEVYIDAMNDGPDCLTPSDARCYGLDDAQITVGMENLGETDPSRLIFGGLAGGPDCDFSGPHPELCEGVVREVRGADGQSYAGWQAEIAIALETLGNEVNGNPDGTPEWVIDPRHGTTIGWNMHGQDDDGGEGRDHKLIWSRKETQETAWRNPGSFGKLVFIDITKPLPGALRPVSDLQCSRRASGEVALEWTNPQSADATTQTRILVDGAEVDTVAGDAERTVLAAADVPLDGTDHEISVVNNSNVPARCTVPGRLPTEPPELEEAGGRLHLNCGGSAEVTDPIGRVWQVDDPFLAPGHPATNAADFGGASVDISLLDEDIPVEVIRSERWCDCTIHYQMLVPAGDYRVILYFSENCEGCVSRALGGTNDDPNAARIFDLQVEESRVEAYNQADAVRGAPDDGQGAILTASQLVFDVKVEDDILDIRVIDRGGGNPPENSAIKAIVIERAGTGTRFIRGNIDAQGTINISDPIFLLSWLFQGGAKPPCLESGNVDGQGTINISDPIFLLSWLFQGGPPPPAPFPDCGRPDPDPGDAVDCQEFTPCPGG